MPNQYNAAQFANVPQKTGASDEEAQPANKVYDLLDAPAKLNVRPTPGSGQFFGTAATTSRATGKGAWDGGAGSNKVVDFFDAPFKLNKDPNLQSNV